MIKPLEGNIYAPCDGEVVMIYPTGHAIGIKTGKGIEMLIHIGINTVELNGKGFNVLVKQGQKIKQGELLVQCDLNTIKDHGYDTDIVLVFTSEVHSKQLEKHFGLVDKSTVILEI